MDVRAFVPEKTNFEDSEETSDDKIKQLGFDVYDKPFKTMLMPTDEWLRR